MTEPIRSVVPAPLRLARIGAVGMDRTQGADHRANRPGAGLSEAAHTVWP